MSGYQVRVEMRDNPAQATTPPKYVATATVVIPQASSSDNTQAAHMTVPPGASVVEVYNPAYVPGAFAMNYYPFPLYVSFGSPALPAQEPRFMITAGEKKTLAIPPGTTDLGLALV